MPSYAYLYDVCSTEWYLPTCMISSYLMMSAHLMLFSHLHDLPTHMSAYLYVCLPVCLSTCMSVFFGIKALASLHLEKFLGSKRYNHFAHSNFGSFASSLKTSGIWSNTIALTILSPGNRVLVSLQSTLFSESWRFNFI
jgi:hypothetical protein